MRYGFKSKAEKFAVTARIRIGQGQADPLDCLKYLSYVGVTIINFSSLIIPSKSKRQLIDIDSESWSGMTIKQGDITAIVINPAHSEERRRNTLMHELSHVQLEHVPTRVDIGLGGILLVSEYSEDDEEEADWLAGAMLLPREAIIASRKRGMTNDEIASHYGVSAQLFNWRLRMTGIEIQLRRSSAR